MTLARIKTWIAGEVLTASDLNGEFNNIIDNLSFALSSQFADGSVSVPSIAFINDTNTGAYLAGADQLELVAGGATAFRLIRLAAGTSFAQFARRGSVGERFYPPLTFGNPDDGLASTTAGTVDLIAGGRRVAQASSYVNATNYLVFTPGQTGTPAVLETGGGDTNVPLLLRAKGTGYVTASRFVFESFAATQSSVQAGRAYWHTIEGALHIDAGTLIARVPAMQGVMAGDLIQAAAVDGATSYTRLPASGEASLLRIKNAAPVYMAVGAASQYLKVATGGGDIIYGSAKTRIHFTDAASLATGTTTFIGPWADSATESNAFVQHLIPYPGRIRNLYAKLTTAPGANQDVKFTVRVNGASVFTTLTISGAAVSGSNRTDSAPVNPGDYVTIQATSSTGAAGTTLTGALELDDPS